MRAASLMSTSGAARSGAVCESTTARSVSTVSFDSQQGQVTSIVGDGFFGITVVYAKIRLSGAGFSLRGFVLAKTETRRLKPAPLHCTALHCTALHCTALDRLIFKQQRLQNP